MGSWRLLLRIAVRDALRAKGRSLLIVAMIALPVLGLTATDVVLRSGQLGRSEVAARALGRTQALISYYGSRVEQAPNPSSALIVDGSYSPNPPPPPLPAGYRIIESRLVQVTVPTRTGRTRSPVTIAPLADPVFHGRYRIEQGRAATAQDEIAVSKQLFDRLGVPLGGSLNTLQPRRHLRLVGVLDQVGNRNIDMMWAPPGTPFSTAAATVPDRYLVGTRPFSWSDVLALNRQGYAVTSRAVLLHQPTRSAVPLFQHDAARAALSSRELITIVGIALGVGLAMLEVVLLAGAAFAVGTDARSAGWACSASPVVTPGTRAGWSWPADLCLELQAQ